jgi:hypothetical protein
MSTGSNLVILNGISLCPIQNKSQIIFLPVAGAAIVVAIGSAKPFKID